jgi:hypothetical protein
MDSKNANLQLSDTFDLTPITPSAVLPKENNKLQLEDRAAHDWYRFVLSFPPHLVRRYTLKFGLNAHQSVLDPFCGTGTTLVECKKLKLTSIGIEPNPMACFASRIKVDWDIDPDDLLDHAYGIAQITNNKLRRDGIEEWADLQLFFRNSGKATHFKTLPEETWKCLLKDSISPLPLHKTLVLLETLSEHGDARFCRHEQLALAKAIVFGISNLHFGPEVGVGPAKRDAPVVDLWWNGVQAMVADLRELRGKGNTKATVHMADSRHVIDILKPNTVDAVITSPPYPNEKDYTRTTRLESVLLGFIQSKQDLRLLKQTLIRSNTRGVYKDDHDDLFVANHQEIQRIATDIEKRRIELGKTSGFERLYARVTKLYFGGMARHLSDLRAVLRPGAQLAYVVGDQASYLRVMIRTGQLLADIAESLGYDVTGIDLFRTRRATATRESLREEVVLLRWPGKNN